MRHHDDKDVCHVADLRIQTEWREYEPTTVLFARDATLYGEPDVIVDYSSNPDGEVHWLTVTPAERGADDMLRSRANASPRPVASHIRDSLESLSADDI